MSKYKGQCLKTRPKTRPKQVWVDPATQQVTTLKSMKGAIPRHVI
jgi:hypothetical protein